MKLVWLQSRAEMLRVLRNPYFVFWSLLMPIVFYFIFTKVVNTNAPDIKDWQAHYLMSMTSFSVMDSAIMTLGIRMVQERTQGWSTFIRITPLPDTVYFIAQMVGQTVIHVLSITVIFIAGAIINNVALSVLEWMMCGIWILVGSIPFLALGTLIGAMKKVDTAAGVSNVLYMILAVAGGMWMPLEVMPTIMQKIGVWLPSYHYGNGAWEIVQGNYPNWKNIIILISYLFVFMLLSNYIRRKQEVM